ncbi:MAG: prolyl oligopeptidase family serine peptidase [Gemmatimonadales bacterium]
MLSSLLRLGGAGSLAVLAAVPARAQTAARELTVPWIMRGPETVGREPANVRWSPDGRWLYFDWLEPGASWREPLRPFRVAARAGARPEALSLAAADSAGPATAPGVLSPDRRSKAVTYRGDLFLVSLPSGAVRRLTETAAIESDPAFDRGGTTLFYSRDQNLYSLTIADGGVRQLTDIRPGPAPDTAPPRGQRGFVAGEEKRLLAAIRDGAWQDSVARARREELRGPIGAPVYLGRGERVTDLVPSPSGTHVLVITANQTDTRRAQVPNYVTSSGYTEDIDTRIKVGDAQARRRVGLLRLGGTVRWIRPIPGDSSGSYAGLGSLGWNDSGDAVLLRAVTADYTTRHLVSVLADSLATVRSLDVLRDTAWVGGPCGGCGGWLPGSAGLWFVSEADGYAHLYTMGPDGSGRTQRTRGKWEVLDADLTPDRSRWALHTSEPSPFERQFYLLPVAGGAAERVTQAVGGHTVRLAPDGTRFADVFSTGNRPPELFLGERGKPGSLAALTTSPTAEWLAFPWLAPDIVMVPASDGVEVPARIYRPEQLGARPNGAAVIFVHGAGYLHNVHNYWSSYFREYQFNHLLAQKGFVVLDLDYRASAGYGRDWRTAIYRHMGGRDLQDQVDGARYLNREFGVSFDRIGMYGGSYGGFITLMALFTEGRYFGAGAALRSVTDWAHYNHPYTAAILNEPQDDSTAFRRSSPIYFAEGLNDPLLMAHGMVDTNVHFQDIVRLTQRLIEVGKNDWELAVYPVENHGFERPDSWTDEYSRILNLFERRLVPR